MEIYLDNNATTALDDRVAAVFTSALREQYGNASSVHALGTSADATLQRSRTTIAHILGVSPDWVIFTSGGTESNNAAIKGLFSANSNRGRRVVTTAIEHSSVLEPFAQLGERGASVCYVPPDGNGTVDPAAIAAEVTEETVLVSVMHVNNETGAIQAVREISTLVRERNRRALLHVDAVQAFGKIPIRLDFADAYSVSAHKLHGPKGVGALLLRPGIRFEPLLAGGGHEGGLRSGTENVPGIVAFERAAALAYEKLDATEARLSELKMRLEERIAAIEGAHILSGRPGVANTVLAAFPPVPGEIFVNALSERGIYVSTGAACSNRRQKSSHVLSAMGYKSEVLESSIRFSMSRFTTADDIDRTAGALETELPRLRRAALQSVS